MTIRDEYIARVGGGIRAFDVHLPVLAVIRTPDGRLEAPRLQVYGTAFSIAPGVFVTAGHVLRDAKADGDVALAVVTGAGDRIYPYLVTEAEHFEAIDLAVMACPGLRRLPTLPLDFDVPLDILMQASAIGFPMAVEAPWLVVIPRAFGGNVITRRGLYQLPQHPPGYELSFWAPQGLSGAPLISTEPHDSPFCYGYMIQQCTLGTADAQVPVGVAVSIEVLLGVESKVVHGPLAQVFGREVRRLREPLEPRLVIEQTPPNLEDGWPE